MIRRAPRALSFALLLSSCLVPVGPGVSGRVDLAPGVVDPVRLVYLGTGGWIMQHGREMVLAAPFFTNPGVLRTGLAEIRSDTVAVARHMAAFDSVYDVSRAVAILSGHAHYDHLMDVPHVARRFAPRADILANRTARNTLGSWSGVADRVRVVNDSAGDWASQGAWLRFGERTRVMALRSHHAAHFEGHLLYDGVREDPLTEEPSWATEWLAGQTHAYLVDFMSASGTDSIAFRIYYQDAVAAAPAGLAPEAMIRERRVDVAILAPSTFDQVDWNPEAFVDHLRPRWVMVGHWEDFFRPVEAPTKSIRTTDIRHFERRLDRVLDGEWWRPEIGTEFLFPPARASAESF